jgi:hypothetical protein
MVLVPPLRGKEEEKASTVAAWGRGRPKDSSGGRVIRIENQFAPYLRSRLIDQSRKTTSAAMQIAEKHV